ncbi:MAG: CBS domain-containing protein [Phycisphaera sp. RhM]|nr:CBS domain-containing protein [Phycisphaera sp. RhM]
MEACALSLRRWIGEFESIGIGFGLRCRSSTELLLNRKRLSNDTFDCIGLVCPGCFGALFGDRSRTVRGAAVVCAVSQEMAAGRIRWTNARVPVTDPKDEDVWSGVVLRRDVLAHLARDEFDRTQGSLAKPLHRVPMNTPGHVLLKSFLSERSHLFGVVNESGTVVGIVTLEDVMESLIGEEIVDEVDVVVDMQELARQREQGQSNGDRGNPS